MIVKFKLLLIPLLLAGLFIANYGFACSTERRVATVGLLGSIEDSYRNEVKYYNKVTALFTDLGAKVVLLDYNKLADQDCQLTKQRILSIISHEQIDRIFIPGDYYNISSNPLRPTNNRQLAINALSDILENNRELRSLAVCGGLQALMHSKGVEIIRVDKLLHDKHAIDSHIISRPSPRSIDADLHKIDIDPSSRLAAVVSRYAVKTPNKLSIYIVDNHVEAINHNQRNLDKLSALGYTIVAVSEDGIIESVEDGYGNIYFQAHPESLAVNADEKYNRADSELKRRSVMASLEIIIDFLGR